MARPKKQHYAGNDYDSIAHVWREVVKPISSIGYAQFKTRVRRLGLIQAIERPLSTKAEAGRIGGSRTKHKFRLPGSILFDEQGDRIE